MRAGLIFACLLSGCTADKALHVGAGVAVIGATGSCGAAWAAGIGKELHDATGRGTVDPMDAIATGVSGCLVSYFLQ
jgi:hypothetical protein